MKKQFNSDVLLTDFKKFMYYNLGGGAYFVVGYALFAGMYGWLQWHWLIAKVISDGIGWVVNYTIQHYLAFHDTARAQGHMKILRKLIPFSLFNIPLDYAIVGGLKWLGVTPYIGLIVSSIFFTIWKWLWYKHLIFGTRHIRT